MKYIMILMLISVIVLTACATNQPVACTEEAKVCSDGTTVVRDANNNCEFPECEEIKLQAIACPEERTQACTREYVPVCGQVQVQCITTPCPPIMQTFSNKCEACANELTISYTEGACAESEGTVLTGTLEEQCISIGGQWTGYDCETISQEQCQEIGGIFNECASACRNDPTAEICTVQCVQVCTLG